MISRSLLADFRHVWSEDPALDKSNENYSHEEFVRTGDFKHVPAKEGERLTIFILAPLTRVQFQRVQSVRAQGDVVNAAVMAVSYGLRGVQNFHDANGAEIEVKLQVDGEGERRVTSATLDAIYDIGLLAQLGARIISESTLRPKNGQG
jgi:hypothetical protein